jgi:serine/threonine protein kinase
MLNKNPKERFSIINVIEHNWFRTDENDNFLLGLKSDENLYKDFRGLIDQIEKM